MLLDDPAMWDATLMGEDQSGDVREGGLDPREACRQARASEHHRQAVRQHGFDRLRAFLEDLDLIGGPSMILWRRAGLVA